MGLRIAGGSVWCGGARGLFEPDCKVNLPCTESDTNVKAEHVHPSHLRENTIQRAVYATPLVEQLTENLFAVGR
jgi:hypothetical protein